MSFRTIAAAALLATTAVARTDLEGCTSYETVATEDNYNTPYFTRIWYVPGSGELCDFLDCGGGRAPPKTTVPGCPGYEGTKTYEPSFINPATLGKSPYALVASKTKGGDDEVKETETASVTEGGDDDVKKMTTTMETSMAEETASESESASESDAEESTKASESSSSASATSTEDADSGAARRGGAFVAVVVGVAACFALV